MPGPPAASQPMDTTAADVAGPAPAGTPPATSAPPAGTLLTPEELADILQNPPTGAAAAAAAATQPSGAAAADTRSQVISIPHNVLMEADQVEAVGPDDLEEDDADGLCEDVDLPSRCKMMGGASRCSSHLRSCNEIQD